MKNSFAIVLSCWFAVVPVQSFALTATANGHTWNYTVSNGEATIYRGNEMCAIESDAYGSISVPNRLGEYIVTSIGDYAFYSLELISSVSIPNSVTSIGKYAFWDCTGLSSVTFPSGLTCIGENAFSYTKLKSVILPNTVTNIGSTAFAHCSKLTSVSIPEGVTSIGNLVFSDCPVLTNVSIPDSVTSIGRYAFEKCTGLKTIQIPDNVTKIDVCAFSGCTSLSTIKLPDGLRSIGNYAFSGCSGLRSVLIPAGVTSIGGYAFQNCSGLTAITIPKTVTSIGDYAFKGCSGLTITMPSRFKNTQLHIPSGCTIQYYDFILEIVSELGTASPDRGTHYCQSGASMACSVSNPSATDGIRYVCVGWNGTGDVPLIGTGTNVVFSVSEDSTLRWLWETNVWIECSVSGDVSSVGLAEWRQKDSAPAVVPFEMVAKHCITEITGDTNGVVVDMMAKTVTIPTDAPHGVSIEIVDVVGTGSFPLPWSDEDGVVPWTMVEDASANDGICLRSGEIPSKSSSSTEVKVEGRGMVEFDWKISAGVRDRVRVLVDGDEKWRLVQSNDWTHASAFIETEGSHTVRWVYEKLSANPMGEDAAFLDNVQWRPARTLSVSSVAGKPVPKRGSNTFFFGDEIAASVASTVPPRGTRHTCLGWTGTGSVPVSGAETNVTFEITEDSSISWNWLTEHRIEFHPSGAVNSDLRGVWVPEGETVVVPWRLLAGCDSLSLGGDTDGVVLDETARTLAIPADRPRMVTLRTNKAISLADALDAPGIGWSTDDGLAAWLGQDTDSSDGEDAATSGVTLGGVGSVLTATINGPGTLFWKWKLVANGVSGVDVIVDDAIEAEFWIEDSCDWTDAMVEISGDGSHAVRFLFWNTGAETGDHVSMDCVSWSGAPSKNATQATPVPVPFSWLTGYGLALDGNYDGAAFASAANGIDDVWQCYVSGISPIDPLARFLSAIRMVNDEPVVTPNPDLGMERVYEVQGKKTLDVYDWGPTNKESRFFRVKVEMPE